MNKRISSLKLTYEEQYGKLRAGDGQSCLTAVKQTMEEEKEMPVVPDEITPSPQQNSQIEEFSNVSNSLYPISHNQSLLHTRKRFKSHSLTPPVLPHSVLPDNTLTNHIYGIEDSLRHRMNVELENFRAYLQQNVSEQFTALHYYCKQYSRYDHQSTPQLYSECHVVPNVDADLPLSEAGELYADPPDSYSNQSDMDSTNQYDDHMSPQDSGVGSCSDGLYHDIALLDSQLDQIALQLLTTACCITATLRRTEYSL